MAQLKVRLMGSFEVRARKGGRVDIPSRKAQALLAYLCLRPGRRHSRERLAALLWGESGDARARASLRQTLASLRKALGEPYRQAIVSDGVNVYADAGLVNVDVALIERLLAKNTVSARRRAVELCRGDLLEDLDIAEEPYEEWLALHRNLTRELLVEALSGIADDATTGGDVSEGISAAIRLLDLDAHSESAQLVLARLYQLRGRHGDASRLLGEKADSRILTVPLSSAPTSLGDRGEATQPSERNLDQLLVPVSHTVPNPAKVGVRRLGAIATALAGLIVGIALGIAYPVGNDSLNSPAQPHEAVMASVSPIAEAAYRRGLASMNGVNVWRVELNLDARREFQRAIELDPSFAQAYAGLGWTYWSDFILFNLQGTDRDRAVRLAKASIKLRDNALAHRLLAKAYFDVDNFNDAADWERLPSAMAEARIAVALAPNDADALADLALYLALDGQAEEAAVLVQRARQLNPRPPPWYGRAGGIANFLGGNYRHAAKEFSAWSEGSTVPGHAMLWLAAAHAQAGNVAAARRAFDRVHAVRGCKVCVNRALSPSFIRLRDPGDRERYLEALRLAGAPI